MFDASVLNKEFFGRTEVVFLLDKRVSALKEGYRQNIAITGQRLSGKTYLLYYFLDKLKDPAVLPIYVEIISEPFVSFANRFMGTLLYTFLKMKDEDVSEDIEYLLKKAGNYIPQTVKSISEIKSRFDKKDFDKAYIDILNLTSIVKKEAALRCIVILDEFQNLGFFGIKEPFSHFGKVMMIQKDTMYIISSSDKSAIQKILTEKLSLLFGNFEVIELKGFDFNSSRDFLNRKLADFNISQTLIDFLIIFTDGNPFYMELLCAKSRELAYASSTNVITTMFIVDAIEHIYFNPKGTVNQYFTNLINSFYLNTTAINILVALAKGCHTLKEIKQTLKESVAEISLSLKRLIELNIIFKNGTFYFFIDSAFLFWISEVYNRKQVTLISSAAMRAEQFRGDIHSYVTKLLYGLKKDCRHRILQLLNKFNDEIVEIDRKKHRLPTFNKVDLISLNRTDSVLLAHKDRKLWLWLIKEGRMGEDDILSFLKEIEVLKLKPKIVNKVLIPLDGIDINAKLLAKENKMWLWNLKGLNFIMGIYNQCKLVRYK